MTGYDLADALDAIDPASLDYDGWLRVGMAMHAEGMDEGAWDEWSRRDPARYVPGECARKWAGFGRGGGEPVAGGTIVRMAADAGWEPSRGPGRALSWDDEVEEAPRFIDPAWVESAEVSEPGGSWEGWRDLVAYLEAVFEEGERVGYAVESRLDDDGRWKPSGRGFYDRTRGELVRSIEKHAPDLGAALGDANPEAGAWIRFNPLDGRGVRNENVAEFRYALVESDSMSIERQRAIIGQLELPCAAIVHSGNKSLHAIVHVDARDYDEYRRRVDFLYETCRKNGLDIDGQNKNPSRLSRMPGVRRGGAKQWLVAVNVGRASWAEWREWLDEVNDDLPEPEALADVWDDLPPLAPPLIEGVLRQGHKMLLAGPSKAGKSFALIELCVAIAEGAEWLGFRCAQGRVLYVNLELDRASCLHRFKDVYGALGIPAANIGNIDVWNLRGKSKPMDKLAPSLIRRAMKTRPIAVVIDPIYKVITGDENSADQMAHFCNQFDKVATELGCAVVYCHHHSKGGQGQKRSMDRASGSGVFARDPDALIDMIELHRTDEAIAEREDAAAVRACEGFMDARADLAGWREVVPAGAMATSAGAVAACKELARQVGGEGALLDAVAGARAAARAATAWRVEGTLREFPRFDPADLWFDYPRHEVDAAGSLKEAAFEGDVLALAAGRAMGREAAAETRARDRDVKNALMREAMAECGRDGVEPTRANVLERIGEYKGKEVSAASLRRWTTPNASKWSEIVIDPEREREGVLRDLARDEMLEDW